MALLVILAEMAVVTTAVTKQVAQVAQAVTAHPETQTLLGSQTVYDMGHWHNEIHIRNY